MPRKGREVLQGAVAPESGPQSLPGGVCGESFDAFDGQQTCGRPKGHPGTHTKEPLSYERSKSATKESFALVGIDSSLTAVSAVSWGYDAKTDSYKVEHGEIRWSPETDYFERIRLAAGTHELVLDLLRSMWTIETVYIALEEPFPFGMLGGRSSNFQASFAKQLAEVSGAVKGSLTRWGFKNLVEVNNSSWHKSLRQDGVTFETVPRGTRGAAKTAIQVANKFRVKSWAITAYGLPEFPDLVAARSGAKIPRPESGYGAKAKAVQADDRYDACAVLHWLRRDLEERGAIPT
jgi:hypothetical protein